MLDAVLVAAVAVALSVHSVLVTAVTVALAVESVLVAAVAVVLAVDASAVLEVVVSDTASHGHGAEESKESEEKDSLEVHG